MNLFTITFLLFHVSMTMLWIYQIYCLCAKLIDNIFISEKDIIDILTVFIVNGVASPTDEVKELCSLLFISILRNPNVLILIEILKELFAPSTYLLPVWLLLLYLLSYCKIWIYWVGVNKKITKWQLVGNFLFTPTQ